MRYPRLYFSNPLGLSLVPHPIPYPPHDQNQIWAGQPMFMALHLYESAGAGLRGFPGVLRRRLGDWTEVGEEPARSLKQVQEVHIRRNPPHLHLNETT